MGNLIIVDPSGGGDLILIDTLQGVPGPGSGTSPTIRIAVTHANSPFAMQPYQGVPVIRHITDPSGGAIVMNVPAGQVSGTQVAVKVETAPSNTLTITINAPAGGTIEDTLEHAGAGMVMVASVVLNLAAQIGSTYVWECDGSNNWTMV
jgi:hypothetical protein